MIRSILVIIAGLLRIGVRILVFLARLGIHHPAAGLIMAAGLIAVVLFWKVALTRDCQGWRRVRSIRFRLWLWLRPGRGFASLPELWLRWGRLAALSYGARSRPGLSLPVRLIRPATEFAAQLGRAQYGRRLYAAFIGNQRYQNLLNARRDTCAA